MAWESTTDENVLNEARTEIWRAWRQTCADNESHAHAPDFFRPDEMPTFYDPFAGGGSLPLEAERLGFVSFASDLNPVAVLINKAMIEFPPHFSGRAPVNPMAASDEQLVQRNWQRSSGLAEDVELLWVLDSRRGEASNWLAIPTIPITSRNRSRSAGSKSARRNASNGDCMALGAHR